MKAARERDEKTKYTIDPLGIIRIEYVPLVFIENSPFQFAYIRHIVLVANNVAPVQINFDGNRTTTRENRCKKHAHDERSNRTIK